MPPSAPLQPFPWVDVAAILLLVGLNGVFAVGGVGGATGLRPTEGRAHAAFRPPSAVSLVRRRRHPAACRLERGVRDGGAGHRLLAQAPPPGPPPGRPPPRRAH